MTVRAERHECRRLPLLLGMGIVIAVVVSIVMRPEIALAQSQTQPQATPSVPDDVIDFRADTLSHDRDLDIITASGGVEITFGGRTLIANAVSYDQKNDIMTASGNVTLLEESGEVLFSDYVELSGDMQNGIAANMRMILSDGARIAANGGRRINADTEFVKAVYSPCNLCEDDPEKAPLWQLKAVNVYHDREEQRIKYKDAWLEVGGVPVVYTPYLSHPDPTTPRQSGFLAPRFGGSSKLGTVIRTPYYWAIDEQRDATITPFYASKEGPGALMNFRQRMYDGTFDMDSSLAYDSEDNLRGHVESEVRFDVDDTWRWGFDVHRATDDTYMARYGISHPTTLESRLFVEGFRDRNYLSVESYAFQGLGAGDNPDTIPLVLPLIEFEHQGQPGRAGGRFGLNGNIAALDRDDGTDTRRVSVRPYWHLPYTAPKGDIYDLTVELKADGYHVNDHLLRDNEGHFTGFTGRVVPEASFGWRYPFVRRENSSYQLFEPIARAFVSPNGGNLDTIPNEDSQTFEFDDTNLFTSNRFSGIDKVEGGARIHYGFRWGLYGESGGRTEVLVGQSYRPRKDQTFGQNTGLEDNVSDFVGKVLIQPGDHLDLHYRTRIDKDSFDARRHEIRFSAGIPAFRVATNYLFVDAVSGSEFVGREETNLSIGSKINKHWKTNFSAVRDEAAGETRSMGLNLIYEDECLVFKAEASRQFFQDRELEPENSLFFTLTFKTLGEVRSDSGLF